MEPNFKKRRKIACITSALVLIALVSYNRCSGREPAVNAYQKAVVENVEAGLKDAKAKSQLAKVGL
jgi:hypothetical protein